MQPTQDPRVVLAVVVFLGVISVGGLAALTFLIWCGVEAALLVAVTGITGPCIGGLVGILATTSVTPAVAQQQAEAVGYGKAIADVNALPAGSTA